MFGGKQLGFTNFYSMSASCIAAAGVQHDGFGKISTLLGILNKLCDFRQFVLFFDFTIICMSGMGIYLLPCILLFLSFYLHGNYAIN